VLQRLHAAGPAAMVAICALLWIPWGVAQVATERVDYLPRVGQLFIDAGSGGSEAIDQHATVESPVGYDGQFSSTSRWTLSVPRPISTSPVIDTGESPIPSSRAWSLSARANMLRSLFS
jgi:hypothetical protein